MKQLKCQNNVQNEIEKIKWIVWNLVQTVTCATLFYGRVVNLFLRHILVMTEVLLLSSSLYLPSTLKVVLSIILIAIIIEI